MRVNANPLARRLLCVYQPIARTSINVAAGVVIDIVYGFVPAGMFMLLAGSLPRSSGVVKGLTCFGISWWQLCHASS